MGLWSQDCLFPKDLLSIQHEIADLWNFTISFLISFRVLEAGIRQTASRKILRLFEAKSDPLTVTSLEQLPRRDLKAVVHLESDTGGLSEGSHCVTSTEASTSLCFVSAWHGLGCLGQQPSLPSVRWVLRDFVLCSHLALPAQKACKELCLTLARPWSSPPALLLHPCLLVAACLSLCCPLWWLHVDKEPGETRKMLYPSLNCEHGNNQAFRLLTLGFSKCKW